MKTNELMPGDWVTVTEDNNEFIGKVQAINAITNYCIVKVGGDWHGNEHDVFIEDMQPVPLTPEILEKNGFTKDSGGEELYSIDFASLIDVGYGFELFISNDEKGEFNGIKNYVHELQHALRLCGIEKEIII